MLCVIYCSSHTLHHTTAFVVLHTYIRTTSMLWIFDYYCTNRWCLCHIANRMVKKKVKKRPHIHIKYIFRYTHKPTRYIKSIILLCIMSFIFFVIFLYEWAQHFLATLFVADIFASIKYVLCARIRNFSSRIFFYFCTRRAQLIDAQINAHSARCAARACHEPIYKI